MLQIHQREFVKQDCPILALNKVFIQFGGEFEIGGEFKILGGESDMGGGELKISRRVRAFIHFQIDQSNCESLQKTE